MDVIVVSGPTHFVVREQLQEIWIFSQGFQVWIVQKGVAVF